MEVMMTRAAEKAEAEERRVATIIEERRRRKAEIITRAERRGRDDQAIPDGTRIFVAGRGPGSYVSFKRNRIGANEHTIAFDSGETVAVKLKKGKWTVREDEMDEMEARESRGPPAADVKP